MSIIPVAKVLFLGSDHAGYALKEYILEQLAPVDIECKDLGTHAENSCDYPEFAAAVSNAVMADPDALGVLICGTGQGMAMTANRFPGVRAAVCVNEYHARMARNHNDANILCLGERVLGPGLAVSVTMAFLAAPFEGGRHQRRLELIDKLAKSDPAA